MMKTVETISTRLRDAISQVPEGDSFEEKVAALHSHVRSMGIVGHHSTRYKLRRWIDGLGHPPPYWINVASEFLGVRPMWLQTGSGVRISHGEARPESEARRGPKQAASEPKKEEEVPKKEEAPQEVRRTRKAKKPVKPPKPTLGARDKRRKAAAKKKEIPPPPDPETEVTIPTKEDVHATKAHVVTQYLERTKSREAVKAVKAHEKNHPSYKGGRKGVLRAVEEALERIEGGKK